MSGLQYSCNKSFPDFFPLYPSSSLQNDIISDHLRIFRHSNECWRKILLHGFSAPRESKEALVQSGQIVSGEAAWAHCVRYRIVRCPWHQVANACIEWPLLSAIAENGKHMKVFTDKFPLAVGGTGMRFLIASWVALHPSCMQILRAGMPLLFLRACEWPFFSHRNPFVEVWVTSIHLFTFSWLTGYPFHSLHSSFL